MFLGYDRRHYPEKNRFAFSECIFKPIDHDHLSSPPSSPPSLPPNADEQWRPHGRHIEPMYTKYVFLFEIQFNKMKTNERNLMQFNQTTVAILCLH